MSSDPEDIDRELTAQDHWQLSASATVAEQFASGGGLDNVTYTDEPIDDASIPREVSPLVVRSLRIPVDLEVEAGKIARSRGVPVTALMREWIAAGVAQAAETAKRDPVIELGQRLDEANRAYQALLHRRDAA